jgi:hypothetical protein
MKTQRAWFIGAAATALTLAACSQNAAVPHVASPLAAAVPRAVSHAVKPEATPEPGATPIALGGSMGVATWADGDSPAGGQGKAVDGLTCDKHMDSATHIHVHLDIFDANGNQLQMPWAIGIVAPWGFGHRPSYGSYVETGTCYYDLHSHDRDGVIHYETDEYQGLTLGNFFDVWGEQLSMTDVAGLTGTVWVMYGTKQPKHMTWSDAVDPRTIPLVEHEYVELAIDNPPKPETLPVYRWTY